MTEPINGIRYAALLDTETSGMNPDIDRTLEVAVQLFDVKHAQPVASFSSLIQGPAENAAEQINGIPAEMLPEAREAERVWAAVKWIIEPAQVIIAHHAEFDRQFCPDLGKNWVCSEEDIHWPNSTKGGRGGSLAHLALSLGLGVASAHRAACDVDTLSRILTRIAERGKRLEPILLHAMRPKVMLHSLAPFEQKDLVKSHGFRWEQDKKVWWRRMPLEDAAALPFKTRAVS
jgi:DNA polymerase-3 subunit epsilon